MTEQGANKAVIQNMIQTIWREGNLAALPTFWTADCINHAMPTEDNVGLDRLHAYHQQFGAAFSSFSNVGITVVNQIAEADQVTTHMVMTAQHDADFMGMPATGKSISLTTIRVDRLVDGKIAEHWSVADMAGLMQQLQG
jgi:steroid delta-isomerase-like uncharacterized protein